MGVIIKNARHIIDVIRNNYSIMPLATINMFAISLGVATILRTLMKSPDVIIDRRHNPTPWENMIDQDGFGHQYKLYSRANKGEIKMDEDRPKI